MLWAKGSCTAKQKRDEKINEQLKSLKAGLPDFAWFNTPKWENIPNDQKCTKWP
jgi:hypothetical protein